METNDALTKGFNAGYLLQKFEPELAKALLPGLEGVELPYFEGVMAGAKQFVIEKELDKADISRNVRTLHRSIRHISA